MPTANQMGWRLFHRTGKWLPNLWRFFIALSVAAAAAFQLNMYLRWAPENLARHGLIADDAYFYSVLAQNFLRHHRLTFDGDMTTNGVQPLWMIIQILLNLIFPQASSVTLLAISAWACYVGFTFLLVWHLNKDFSIATIFATLVGSGLILLQPYFQRLVVTGLETPLMLCLLILLMIIYDKINGTATPTKTLGTKEVLLLALLATLVFFARTDLFVTPLVVLAWLLIINKRITSQVILFCTVVALMIGPYLAYNYFTQGSLMPISGRVKLFYLATNYPDLGSYFASNEWQGPYIALEQVFGLNFLPINKTSKHFFAFSIFVVCWLVIWRNRFSNNVTASLKLLGIITFCHWFYLHIFYRELRPYTSYYFMPEVIFVALAISSFVEKSFLVTQTTAWLTKDMLLCLRRIFSLLVVLASVLFCIYAVRRNKPFIEPYWDQRLLLARDISKIVPIGEKVAAFWPGLFAQFCGRNVAPLDGIIGSNQYFQEYVKAKNEIEYLHKNNIKYLAIYLNKNFEDFISITNLPQPTWPMLGMKRLWDKRLCYAIKVRSARPINEKGAGWYLLELTRKVRLPSKNS